MKLEYHSRIIYIMFLRVGQPGIPSRIALTTQRFDPSDHPWSVQQTLVRKSNEIKLVFAVTCKKT